MFVFSFLQFDELFIMNTLNKRKAVVSVKAPTENRKQKPLNKLREYETL
jgi:hypothetical protein